MDNMLPQVHTHVHVLNSLYINSNQTWIVYKNTSKVQELTDPKI